MKINKMLFTLALATVTISQLPLYAHAKSVINNKDVIVEEESEMNFSDVSPNHWAYRAIKKLVEEYGVLGGFPDGTFRGNRNLTRYEAAAMIAKVMEKMEEINGGKPAGSNSNLDRLKKEFMTELEDLQSEVKKLSKDQQDLQKDLDETKDDIDMVKEMLPKVKLMGDASIRNEYITEDLDPNKYDVAAPQVRLRLGAYGENNGGFTFGTRIVTSSANDITNHYVSLGNLNSELGINLDQLYVGLRPWDGAIDLTFGRYVNPFVKSSELVWDDDVTFDGTYLKLKFGDDHNNFSILGSYAMFNIAGLDPAHPSQGTSSLFFGSDAEKKALSGMGSAGASVKLGGEAVEFQIAANYHQYMNPNNLIGKKISLNPMTNILSTDGKSYVSNFQLLTGTVSAELFPEAYLPVGIHADVSYNLGAGTNSGVNSATDSALVNKAKNGALGLIAGVSLGKLVDPGNVMLGYSYKMVGADSVYSAFNDDQLGGSNVVGHVIKAGVQMAPMTSLLASMQISNELVASATPHPTHYVIRLGVMQKF